MGDVAQRQDHPGVHVPPPAIYLAFFLAAVAAHRFVPVAFPRSRISGVAGWTLMTLAALIGTISIATFWRRRTTILPMRAASALVTEGPFRFSRNPMYVAMALLYVGAASWYGSVWPLLLFPLVIFVISRFVIAREEAYLERRFGSEYVAYKRRVRRWL